VIKHTGKFKPERLVDRVNFDKEKKLLGGSCEGNKMIPDRIRMLVEKQMGDVHRTNRDSVYKALAALDIPVDCEFAEFFLNFVVTFYSSNVSDMELCDLCEPTDEIEARSEFVWEVWGVPEKYICFSSVESEGCYLYDRESDWICDFSLANRTDFVEGRMQPMFKSFFEFMIWYLAPHIN